MTGNWRVGYADNALAAALEAGAELAAAVLKMRKSLHSKHTCSGVLDCEGCLAHATEIVRLSAAADKVVAAAHEYRQRKRA